MQQTDVYWYYHAKACMALGVRLQAQSSGLSNKYALHRQRFGPAVDTFKQIKKDNDTAKSMDADTELHLVMIVFRNN